MNIEIDFAFRLVLPSYILKSSRMDEAVSFYMRVEREVCGGSVVFFREAAEWAQSSLILE